MNKKTLGIIGMILIACDAALVATPTLTPTSIPTPTSTPAPTRTIRPTEDRPGVDCFRWDEVNRNIKEKEICVFGNFLFSFSAADGNGDIAWWLIRFDNNASTFYIIQDVLPFEIQFRDCILVSGTLQFDDNKTPFIENGKLTKCK